MKKNIWLKKAAVLCMSVMLAAGLAACGSSSGDTAEESSGTKAGTEDQLADPQPGDTLATFHIKDYGDITVRLFPDSAPKAVENFTTHAKEGYYDGVIFHRVINDFMIQGGDPGGTGTGGVSIWGKVFENEITDNLLPIRGALCMANAGEDTNGSQFFIVQAKDADVSYSPVQLTAEQKKKFEENGGCPHLTGGYTVFGQVTEGLDVVDKIAAVKTNASDKPVESVVIESIDITVQE